MEIKIAALWILYAILEGYREGIYWHNKMLSSSHRKYIDEHKLWSIQRAVVLLGITQYASFWLVLLLPCMFPFMHDGMYYVVRGDLDNIYGSWFSQSTTSTAKLTKFFTPVVRTAFFIIGLTGVLWLY